MGKWGDMTRVLRLAAVMIWLAAGAAAATYYVDATGGNDVNSGLASSAAWKTIAKVNGMTFGAGDQILFKRGETWRESLVPPSSGAAGNPITFDAYGTGEAPTITGSLDLSVTSAWTLDSGNIWKATVSSLGMTYVLFGTEWGTRHTTSKTECVAARDYFFMSNTLYVYAVGNPAAYYGTVAAMLLTNGQLIYINGKSWVDVQHFKLTYFDGYGVRIGGAADHIHVANVSADGIIPAGSMPHGFYVSASPTPTDISFYDDDAHRNYNGFRFDGTATGIKLKNCRAYGNRNHGLEDNGGGANYAYCHFYGNGLGVLTSTDVTGGVDGGGNIASYTDPQVTWFRRYEARITLTEDDPGLIDASAYVDGWLPQFDQRGLQPSLAIVTGYDLSNQMIPEFQKWINAGRDVNAHSWSHQYFQKANELNALTIHYTGTGTAGTLTISGNHLTTTVTGGPGGEGMNLDLTSSSYDTLSKLVATINGRVVYAATQVAGAQGAAHTIGLADVAGQDVKGTTYTALFQESRLEADEMASAKAWMNANLTGLPAARVYVYPGGEEDTSTQGYAVTAGYAGGRGAFTMDLGTKDVYARGVNVQNITSFGVNPALLGLTATAMDARIASLVWKSAVWGAPYGVFWHLNELTPTEVGNLLDALIAHGALVMTNTQLVNWIKGTTEVGTGTYWVTAATGAEADMRPTAASPVVNAGTDLGAGFRLDLEGNDQAVWGPQWEMGAYAYVGGKTWVVVVN